MTFQVNINYQSGTQVHDVTPSRKTMVKAVARQSKLTIARECIKDQTTRSYVMKCISRIIQSEMKKMCSHEANSILKQQLPINFEEFSWDSLIGEVQTHAPVLYSFMNACTKTKKPRSNKKATIGMCVAILLKYRYSNMCLVQKIVSLILYAGHSAKQVCM